MLTINKQPEPDRLIVIGYGSRPIEPPKKQETALPPVETKNKRGRPKKMAKDTEDGVKTIYQEPADKQGPVGTDTEPPPQPAGGEDVNIGEQEDKANG